MTLTPFMVSEFGGIDLRPSPLAAGPQAARDAVNVDFDRVGVVRKRDGYVIQKSLTVTSAGGFAAFEATSGAKQFVVGYANGGTKTYAAYASTGGAAVATAAPTATGMSTARIGTPSSENLYIANGADTIWKWTGAAFSQPAGMPIGKYLAAVPTTNRLAVADATVPSRIIFSDAGAPETFTYDTAPTPDTGNYEDLAPGDGSLITGLASWQQYTFAFKRNRFFVFGGEGLGSAGNPIFDYRAVDGYGSVCPPAAGDEGVYFFDGRYVWLTQGDAPRCVSLKIDSYLTGRTGFGIGSFDPAGVTTLSYSGGRLYVGIVVAGATYATLVYDPKADQWTTYALGVRFAANLDGSVYWFSSGGKVNRFARSAESDDGASITWSYYSGFYDLGYPGQSKVLRECRAWGIGDAQIQFISDGTADVGSTLTFGPNAQGPGEWQQRDREGVMFSHVLGGTTTTASEVHRIVLYGEVLKPAGLE